MNNFFDKAFWQGLVVQVSSTLIVGVIALTIGLYVGSKIDRLTDLFSTVNETLARVETIVEAGPEGIAAVSGAMNDGAETLGASVGEGSAAAIEKAGDAWRSWRRDAQESNPDGFK